VRRGRGRGWIAAAAIAAALAAAVALAGAPPAAFSISFAATLALAGWALERRGGELAALEGSVGEAAASARQAGALLAEERTRLALVLEHMTDGLIVLDPESRVVLANGRARDLLGIDELEPGASLLDYVRTPALLELVTAARDSEQIGELELANLRHLEARCSPLQGGGALLVLREVTLLRRLETVRRDFVANVSHELRTPLSVVRANAETLIALGSDEPEAARQLVAAIARHAERMTHIVNELLDLSRLDSQRYPIELGAVEPGPVAARAIELVAHTAAARETSIATELSSRPVIADAAALERILVNLLENAVKHTPPRSSVTVRARDSGDEVVLEVEDDGPGIEIRHMPRIFERFYRVDAGRSRTAGGTGLGLSIVKNLVELMGGKVALDVGRSRGARFSVRLPAAPPPDRAAP
jgi:two-component system phosphate regulon sensor histidine kinase PhoR